VQPAGVVLGCELLRGQGFPGELKVGGSFATNEFEQNKIEIPEVSDSWLKFNKFNCNCSTQFHFVPFFHLLSTNSVSLSLSTNGFQSDSNKGRLVCSGI
jgi:hypothetical protein